MNSDDSPPEPRADEKARLHTQRRESIERTRKMRREIARLMGRQSPEPKDKSEEEPPDLDLRPRPA